MFTKEELQEIFLSIYTLREAHEENQDEFKDEFVEIYDEFMNKEYTEFEIEEAKRKTINLMNKVVNLLKEMEE